MKLGFLPNFVSKLRKHYFSSTSFKNNVPAIKKFMIEACEKLGLSSIPANQTRRTRSIFGTKSVNELLRLIGNTKKEFESAEIAACCQKLSEHVFQDLKFQPWAVCDERILWHQSKINTGANNLFCDVLQSTEISLILEKVKSHIDIFTCSQVLTVTKSLLHLHVPVGDDVVSALLNKCIQRRGDFNLAELATFSVVGNRLYRNGVPILCHVAQALQELVSERPLFNNLDDFRSNSTILSNILYIVSKSFLEQLLPSFKELFYKYDSQELAVHMDDILSCLEAFKFLIAKPSKDAQFVNKLVSFFVENVDTLSLQQLGRACTLINKLSSMSTSVSDLFQKGAYEFLHHKWLSPTDVIYIVQIADRTVWNKSLITETVSALENVLVDFDVQLLKFLAQTNFLLKVKNDSVTHKFSQCIMAKLPDVMNEVSCLESVLDLFSQLHYKNYSFHKKMIEHLVDKLQSGQMGLMPVHVAYVFKYIVSCGRFNYVPTDLKESLSQKMHQFSFGDVHNLVYQVDCQMSVNGYAKSSEIRQLASQVKRSVLQRKSEVNSLATVNFLMDTFSRKRTIKAFDLLDFSELYDKHAHTVDTSSLRVACRILQNYRLLSTQALQCFADFISAMDYQNDLSTLSLYLETCAVLNFCPANVADFEELITKELIRKYTSNDINLSTVLSVVLNFLILEVFPRDLLNLVFSVGFLKTFDAVCRGMPSHKRQKYEDQLYVLNRSVRLDCPHLNIPWFHEILGKDSTCRISHLRKPVIDQVILEQQLEEILGGPEYFKVNQLAPYFYTLDFECILTKCGLPVARSKWNKLNNVQRIAILLLSPDDFCRNVPQVLGPLAMKLRHLEIMGYRVVEVPYDKLYSNLSTEYRKKVDLKHFLSGSLFAD